MTAYDRIHDVAIGLRATAHALGWEPELMANDELRAWANSIHTRGAEVLGGVLSCGWEYQHDL